MRPKKSVNSHRCTHQYPRSNAHNNSFLNGIIPSSNLLPFRVAVALFACSHTHTFLVLIVPVLEINVLGTIAKFRRWAMSFPVCNDFLCSTKQRSPAFSLCPGAPFSRVEHKSNIKSTRCLRQSCRSNSLLFTLMTANSLVVVAVGGGRRLGITILSRNPLPAPSSSILASRPPSRGRRCSSRICNLSLVFVSNLVWYRRPIVGRCRSLTCVRIALRSRHFIRSGSSISSAFDHLLVLCRFLVPRFLRVRFLHALCFLHFSFCFFIRFRFCFRFSLRFSLSLSLSLSSQSFRRLTTQALPPRKSQRKVRLPPTDRLQIQYKPLPPVPKFVQFRFKAQRQPVIFPLLHLDSISIPDRRVT